MSIIRFNFGRGSPPSLRARLSPMPGRLPYAGGGAFLAAALLALFAGLCFDAARGTSPTYDEPGFILCGYSYVARDCPAIPSDNLRIAEMAIGLPLLALHPKIPDSLRAKKNLVVDQNASELGVEFLFDPANRTEAMLLASRMAVTACAVILGWILFASSRRLFGPAGGLLTLSLYCLNPVIISNSAVATTDMVTVLFFTLATLAYWRLIHRPTLAWTAAFGVALGALLSTKFTGAIFPVIAAALLAVRCTAGPRPRSAWRLVSVNAAAVAVAYGFIWLVYGFHYAHGAPLDPSIWTQAHPGFGTKLVDLCRRAHLLPEAYLFDVHMFLWKLNRLTFFMGRYSWLGFWSFFPLVLFFKTPPALMIALCLAAAAAALAQRKLAAISSRVDLYGLVPFLAMGAVYGAVAVESRFNIGIRHILPVFPLLFVAAGAAVCLPWRRRWQAVAVVGVIVAGSVAEVLIARPNYLAYVNEFGGGPKNGWRLFVDSSFDWGQDLPAVRRWVDRRASRPGGDRPAYFSYFGNGLIDHYGIRAILLPQDTERRTSFPAVLKPGTYIISATMLQGIGSGPIRGPWRIEYEKFYQAIGLRLPSLSLDTPIGVQAFRDYELLRFSRLCAYLRTRRPDAWITPNVLVFELDAESLTEALFGPPPAFVDRTSIPGAPPDNL